MFLQNRNPHQQKEAVIISHDILKRLNKNHNQNKNLQQKDYRVKYLRKMNQQN